MKKFLSVFLVTLLVASFIVGALASDSQANVPQKCWIECQGVYAVECCKFVQPKVGTWVRCTVVGYCPF
ncbi:MAG: hypothetical protein JSW34_01715 [Candidatus Zixiibacteriota bacterium]|nr:MAG: hypothetical protein JSW34_01715 [candidate division Zixibacteria bacterium]